MRDVDDELLRIGFETVGTALFLADAGGAFSTANARFTEMFGRRVADGGPISSMARPDDRAWLDATVARLVAGEQAELRTAIRLVRDDGVEFDGAIGLTAVHRDGHCIGFIGQVRPNEKRDVVDDPRVGKLLEHNAGTLTLIDAEGNVLETAGRYRNTLGYPVEFWETRNLFDVLAPEEAQRVLELRDEILSAPGHVVGGDFTVVDAEGARHVLEVTAVNLLDDDDIRGIVITSRNVTEERATRNDLAVLRDEAVADAERRSALLATVSHELRNPLHALSGLSELLASDATLPAASRELAATLHRQATQLGRVTDDLLETARHELGEMRSNLGPTRLRDVVDDVAQLARAAAHETGVEVRVVVDPEVPAVVSTDGSRIHQLLWNLASNAVKFTDDGVVEIEVVPAAAVAETFPLAIEVRDTGRGIPADDIDEVFQPFRTVSDDDDRSGAGLGLAIVSRIVELLDGTIAVESELGRGTTFRVVVPVEYHDTVATVAAEPEVRAGDGGGPLVLVVEDNEVNQQLARHQLDRLGMRPIIVGTAEDGIALLGERSVDAILMDHQLPGMNGREATRELRRLGVTVPIVGVTASATAADERECLDAGMDAFLPKPVGMAQLADVLERVLRPVSSELTDDVAGSGESGVDGGVANDDAVLDLTTLGALDDELGDPSIVDTLVQTFLGELDSRRADIVGGDRDVAVRQAHTLKSSARLLGANALADACEQVEADPSTAGLVEVHATAAGSALVAWLESRPGRSTS